MRVLFLNGYFYPENIAYTHLEQDILKSIVEDGHTVDVICPVPSRGIDSETRKKYLSLREESMYDGKVRVHRFPLGEEKTSTLMRFIRYFICDFKTYFIAKKYKADVVFAVSTPPIQGLLAGKVARKIGAKFVYNLQDIFPDSLITTGISGKESIAWKIGRKIENATYNGAEKIIVISESMKRNIMQKGVFEEKIVVVSNWIDTNLVKPVAKEDNKLYDEFDIPRDKFVVVYAGNFGVAQGADVVLRAAELLKDNEDVQFVIFGGGAEFEAAKQKAKDMNNVIINPLLPPNRVPEVYSLGDIALITCKKGVSGSGMPSKTWSIMACNTPIIASFDTDSELADVLKESGAGITVSPEDKKALAEAIIKASNENKECKARAYVCKYASADVCPNKYVQVLKDSCKQEGNV